uniref:RNA-directed DNA polymerase n=1 Tax=Sipha flava TaxID=143950 RepID=A0A2S2Q6V8_9HEMI
MSLNFPLKSPLDIDNVVSKLTKSIQNVVLSSSSSTTNKNKNKSSISHSLFLVNHIKCYNFINAKRCARTLWQNIKYSRHKTIYKNLKTNLKTQLAKYRSEQVSLYLSTLTSNNGSFWIIKPKS